MNLFKYNYNNKRYHTLNYEYNKIFGCKIAKISLNGGFTCPNIDGTKGYGGCTYCSKLGSGDFAGDKTKSLIDQFNDVKSVIGKKWKNCKYIAYFQANTNTYAGVSKLKEKYEEVLKFDNVVGLSISTRPDSISDEVLDYLTELNNRCYLTIELGLQTIHEATSKLINRCHTLECFDDMVNKLKQRKIRVVAHIINGLPYETKDMMIETAKHLNKLKVDGVKIHMLHILKDTAMLNLYLKDHFHILTKEEYIDITCTQLEYLHEDIVIHRITGDPDVSDLVEPSWLKKKFTVLNDIDKELERRNSYQGFNRSILNKERAIIDKFVKINDLVVDATVGNGHDILNLSKYVKNGMLFGFDIQKKAILNTKNLLESNNVTNYKLFNIGHENILDVLHNYVGKISLIMFNLGYLPGCNKEITTMHDTTIKAIRDSLKLLNNKGMILVVIYPGHAEGIIEHNEIQKFIISIKDKYRISEYHNTDKSNAPYLIVIEKSNKVIDI